MSRELLHLFALLLLAHALADYPLQGDFLAKAKNPAAPIDGVPWWCAMAAHCGIHAGGVLLVTNSLALAASEFCAHWWIDVAKCRGRISFAEDQLAHVAFKVGWTVWIAFNPGMP